MRRGSAQPIISLIEFDEERFFSRLEELKAAVEDDSLPIREIISELVPTYINPDKKDK